MGQPARTMGDAGEDSSDVELAWENEIRKRVDDIRNGTGYWPDVEDTLAELDRIRAEGPWDPADDGEEDDDDPAEVEAAWAEEIQRRIEEIRSGTAKTYAAEDVFAALRLRFG